MADHPKSEREEPQQTSSDEEHIRGIGRQEDEFEDAEEDLDEHEAEDEETA